MAKQEYHRVALAATAPYCNSSVVGRMNAYLHLDLPPYHKASSHAIKRTPKVKSGVGAKRSSAHSDTNSRQASQIPEMYSYNMHKHAYFPSDEQGQKVENVSDPALHDPTVVRSRSQSSSDQQSATPRSTNRQEFKGHGRDRGQTSDKGLCSGGKDRLHNNNSNYQSASGRCSTYRLEESSPGSSEVMSCRTKLSDRKLPVAREEQRNSDAMNGVLTVEALKQWVPDMKQRTSTQDLANPNIGIQFLNTCQKTLASKNTTKTVSTPASHQVRKERVSAHPVPLLSLRNQSDIPNQNNSNSLARQALHCYESNACLSPVKPVQRSDLVTDLGDWVSSFELRHHPQPLKSLKMSPQRRSSAWTSVCQDQRSESRLVSNLQDQMHNCQSTKHKVHHQEVIKSYFVDFSFLFIFLC